MAEKKSVHFSPIILEHVSDDTSLVSGSDIKLFHEGMNLEEASVAGLSGNAKKYRVPNEDKSEPRRPRTRKIALLALGFIFLLGIAGVAIYLITQKLYKRDGYTYSGNVGEKKTGFPLRNTILQEYTSRLVAVNTTKPSSETSKEHATVYSARATIYLPSITVYESSGLVTGSESRKQNATFTLSFSTQLSRKVASHSLVRQDSNSFLKTSGIKNHWHEAHSFTRHETSSKTKNTASTASVWSTASLQSVTASALSFSDESRSKMSYSLKENASFVTTTPPSAQSSTKSLKNVETVIRRSPNASLKHTWLPSGTEIREFSNRRNFTTAGDNNKFPQTTKQSRQSRFGVTSFTTVTPSKPLFPSQSISEKLNEMQTRGAAIKTEMMAISHFPTTRSTNMILSDRHSISSVSINTLTENVKGSNFNRNMMTSSSDQNVSSNKSFLFSWSRWPTWMQQISSSSYHHLGAGPIQVSLFPKVSSTTSAMSVSLTSLDKHTETNQTIIPNQLLSVLKMSATKFVSPTEKPSSMRSLDSLSALLSSHLLISTLKRRYSTVEEIQASKSIMTNSASVPPTSHTTASNTVTVRQPRNSSTGGFVEYKSMVSPFVTQTLSPYITHDGLLTKVLNTISKPGFQTDPIILKPTPTASIGSSPVEFVTLPISDVPFHSSFGNSKTVTSKATSSNTYSPQSRSSLDSKSTLQAIASLSIFEAVCTSQLGGREVPVITSSFAHLKAVESIKGSLSRHETPFAFQTTFSYNGSIDTRVHSTATSIVIITVIPSSARFILTTTITASRKMTSKVLTVGISVVTFSIKYLRSTESIQESLLSSKTSSDSTKAFQHMLSSSQKLTNLTVTRIHFTTETLVAKYTALSTGLPSSAINNSIEASSHKLVKGSSLTMYLLQPKVNSTISSVFAPNSALPSQANLTHLEDTVFYRVSSLQSTITPVVNPTSNSSTPFKIMDGSLIIRNKNYHTNLSNPNTTMFLTLADEVETIITNIVSLNNTDVLDVEVTSFRNGSVIADFSLRVTYHSPFSDQQFGQLLTEANETLWRGYHVTNITVTLRTIKEGSSEPSSDGHDDTGFSKTAIIATLMVFTALLLTVGGFGVYFCKKKRMCHMSKVKPAGSPIPPSELEKIQPVRHGTWVMNDQPFLKVDVPPEPNNRRDSFYETVSMRILERKDTEPEERVDPDLLRESTKSPFEPNYENTEVVDDSTNHASHFSTPLSVSNPNLIDSVNGPISGSSQSTYLKITSNSEEDHKC